MPTEPASTGIAASVAALSAALLAVLGVDYYSLLWATVGSMFSVLIGGKTSRLRAFLMMIISVLIGAALGTFAAELPLFGGSRSALMVCSLACATAPRRLIVACVDMLVTRINKLAGNPTNDSVPPPNQ